jgi:2-polyprenyl-6-hydroxyphenyl methylase/3-demethylubiquinone-9 3-methyltransferase
MVSRPPPHPLVQLAARSRIDELKRRTGMTTDQSATGTTTQSPWALGDYHRFAKATIWELGPVLVEACGITAGQRVLDVAAGTGNVAIRAALRGAQVVASDITPENFPAGRVEAAEQGATLDWIEADAQALPFADGEFDVVTSSFGAIFAPDHQSVADEMVRVCRPGGVIGMTAFAADGLGGPFFDLFTPFMPPPPAGASPTVQWGDESHVRQLFADRLDLELTRRSYVEHAPTPEAYRDLFLSTFGPAVAVATSLADEPERAAEFKEALLDFAVRSNSGPAAAPAAYRYDYLLIIGRRRPAIGD